MTALPEPPPPPQRRQKIILIVRGASGGVTSRTLYEVPAKEALALAVDAIQKQYPRCLLK